MHYVRLALAPALRTVPDVPRARLCYLYTTRALLEKSGIIITGARIFRVCKGRITLYLFTFQTPIIYQSFCLKGRIIIYKGDLSVKSRFAVQLPNNIQGCRPEEPYSPQRGHKGRGGVGI